MTVYSLTNEEYEVYDIQYDEENRPLFLLFLHGKWGLYSPDLFKPYPSWNI